MASKETQAPLLGLDVPSLLAVEFPLRVDNVDRALAMVGGRETLSRCFIEPDMNLELKLRPQDPYAHPLRSTVLKSSENTLLKLRIPKKVLRMHAHNVQKSLQYCEEHGIKYHVEPVGILRQNYKFRQLADFQVLTNGNKFVNEFSDSVRMGDLARMKEFSSKLEGSLNEFQTFENGPMDVPPLPRYARTDINHGYRYFGNLLLNERGEWLNKSIKLHTIQIKWGEKVPEEYDPKLKEELERAKAEIALMKQKVSTRTLHESPSYHLVQCIEILEKLFEMRPIWIRKHIHLMLPANVRPQLRFALPYVSYTCAKGPWRHSFIRLGYDPTQDSNAAKYQIEAFRSTGNRLDDGPLDGDAPLDESLTIIPPTLYDHAHEFEGPVLKLNGVSKLPRSLLFDGNTLCNCLSYQLGDILDEDVKYVLANSMLEDTCHIGSGWFHWITIARIKTIIKYKLTCIRDNIPISREKVDELISKTTFQRSITMGIMSDTEQDQERERERERTNAREEQGQESDNEGESASEASDVSDASDASQASDSSPTPSKGPDYDSDIIRRLEKFNPNGANIIQDLDSILKQEHLMKW